VKLQKLLTIGSLVLAMSAADIAHALPGSSMRLSRSGMNRNNAYRNSTRLTNPIDTNYRGGFNASVPNYSGLTPHERAAAQTQQSEKQYRDTLQAIKEGRYIPPKDTRTARDPEELRRQLEEQRLRHDAVLLNRRIARDEELKVREQAYFNRTRKGMELQRKAKDREEHKDVDPVKLDEQLKTEAEPDGLKNF